ncbi:Hint domain-containing protein [Aestuariibius insulae]|uniref:Hint domain-containing protein n=1 Tax=Aestuariibius insulae TaxID=2058287 RepID=UPI00345E7906
MIETTVAYSSLVPCFTAGTLIATQVGLKLIEDLEVGDMIETADNGLQPIRWIGRRSVPAIGNLAPVVFAPGAIGNERELVLSPQHRVLLSGWRAELFFGETEVLAPAKHLIGSDKVFLRESDQVEYFHILFDTHEIIFAEGVPCESFHPGEMGLSAIDEDQRNELFSIFPELAVSAESYGASARPSLKGFEASLLA